MSEDRGRHRECPLLVKLVTGCVPNWQLHATAMARCPPQHVLKYGTHLAMTVAVDVATYSDTALVFYGKGLSTIH